MLRGGCGRKTTESLNLNSARAEPAWPFPQKFIKPFDIRWGLRLKVPCDYRTNQNPHKLTVWRGGQPKRRQCIKSMDLTNEENAFVARMATHGLLALVEFRGQFVKFKEFTDKDTGKASGMWINTISLEFEGNGKQLTGEMMAPKGASGMDELPLKKGDICILKVGKVDADWKATRANIPYEGGLVSVKAAMQEAARLVENPPSAPSDALRERVKPVSKP